MPREWGRRVLAALAVAAAIAVVGCGRDDFQNDPNPAVPQEVTVAIKDSEVQVSPASFGAGLTNFVTANLTDDDVKLSLDGPTVAESDTMVPHGTTILKTQVEPGTYVLKVDGSDAAPAEIRVGPERASSNDQLLKP